jgi:hypothetical protein
MEKCTAELSVKAMVFGGVTDIIATVVLTIPLIIYVIRDQLRAATKEPLEIAVMAGIYANPLLYGLQTSISLGCSVFALTFTSSMKLRTRSRISAGV